MERTVQCSEMFIIRDGIYMEKIPQNKWKYRQYSVFATHNTPSPNVFIYIYICISAWRTENQNGSKMIFIVKRSNRLNRFEQRFGSRMCHFETTPHRFRLLHHCCHTAFPEVDPTKLFAAGIRPYFQQLLTDGIKQLLSCELNECKIA